MVLNVPVGELTEGMKTPGGLVVTGVRPAHGYVNIEFSGYSNGTQTREVFYHATQNVEITPETNERETSDMAQRVNILVESDLSGEPEASTVTFGLDGGTGYEIDLTIKEQEKMRKAFAPYIGAARPVKGSTRKRATSSGPAPTDVRAWAKEKTNLDVPERGRIPEAVREAYRQAH